MGFNESAVKIRTRVRSAIGRLRTSKSVVGLTSIAKSDQHIPPAPFPVPVLPEILTPEFPECKSFDDYWDTKSSGPVTLKRIEKRCPEKRGISSKKNCLEISRPPALKEMLEEQGLLDSPISIHLTSLFTGSHDSLMSFSTTTRRRSLSDSVYSTSLLCFTSAGPFTPELVHNPVEKVTPQFCASYFSPTQLEGCVPLVETANDSGSAANSQFRRVFMVESPNPSCPALKLSVSPAQRCLRRQGPIPSHQPISSQLLQSVMSNKSPDPSHDQKSTDLKSHNQLDRIQARSLQDSRIDGTLRPAGPKHRPSLGLIYNKLELPVPLTSK